MINEHNVIPDKITKIKCRRHFVNAEFYKIGSFLRQEIPNHKQTKNNIND